MSAFNQKVHSNRAVLNLPYWPEADGILRPKAPGKCIFSDGSPCQISVKARRFRKCGPDFPLVVFACSSHKVCFTAYPPGWAPFGRKPWEAINEDGTEREIKVDTYFSAVLDMSDAKRWPEEGCKNYSTRRSQERHILSICGLFSLGLETEETRYETAEILNVDHVFLADLANGIREGPSMVAKSKGVRTILEILIQEKKNTFEKILLLGHKLRFWGQPLTI